MAVFLSPLGGAASQFFDDSGVPLSGGKLYTYKAGTTTPQTTYTSKAGTIAHSNPIILDSAGRVPGGEVWLDAAVSYKFINKTSADVLIGTYDNIIGITFGSNNILAYGADPTGVASSVAAVQACQAANTEIYVPQGTFLIDSSFSITSGCVVETGGIFSISSGVTLTVSGPFSAHPSKLFIGAGTVVFGQGSAEEIYPEWFYVSGGYQTAFTKAFAVQAASATASQGMALYANVIPVVLQPNKQYLITGSITGGSYLTLLGNSASIQTASEYPFDHSFPIITNIGYQPTIDNVTFLGGNNVLVFPENAQGYDIVITNCKFTDWQGTAILGSSVAHAQHLICHDCEFTARSVNSCVCDIAWDKAVMKDCQYSGPSTTKFINRNNLVLEDWITSPITPQGGESWPYSPRWIYNEGLALEINRFRFGGEPGAHRILENTTGTQFQGGATSISITESAVYTGGDYVMALNNMPANFVFRDNFGFTSASPILYGGSSTGGVDGTRNIGRCNIVMDAGISGSSRLMYGSMSSANSSATMPRIAAAMNRYKKLGTKTFLTSDKVVDKTYGSMSGGVQPLFTVTTTSDIFGATVQKIIGYDGDNTFNSYSYFQTTDLTGLPAGTYTLVVNITVGSNGGVAYAGNPVSFGMTGSLVEKYWNLSPGSHTLSMELYWDGTNNPEVGYSVYNVDSATYFAHDGFRLFQGSVEVTNWETISYGTAAPSTGYHRKGDRVIQQTPTAGQPKGWVCTVAGTPGTWVSEGTL